VVWLTALLLVAAGLVLYGSGRCFGFHDPLMTQWRDKDGDVRYPHRLRWVCRNCHRTVGETALPVNWRRIMDLSYQAERLRKRV
jgi:hypothetical protein